MTIYFRIWRAVQQNEANEYSLLSWLNWSAAHGVVAPNTISTDIPMHHQEYRAWERTVSWLFDQPGYYAYTENFALWTYPNICIHVLVQYKKKVNEYDDCWTSNEYQNSLRFHPNNNVSDQIKFCFAFSVELLKTNLFHRYRPQYFYQVFDTND